ncbi:MAG: endolytic transglycosylase MltG [Candidatus Microsaccharimonas sp.]
MDIKPPARRPIRPPVPPPAPVPRPVTPVIAEAPALQPIDDSVVDTKKPKRSKKKLWIIIAASVVVLGLAIFAALFIWYQVELSPVDSSNTSKTVIEVEPASTPKAIAELLEEKGVIRSSAAFLLYTRLEGVQNQLQAGSYRLSPSESTPEIVEHLVKGTVDTFTITFYPGATLVDTVSERSKRIDVTTVLQNAGYSDQEIAAGLNKQYDHPIFQDKPATADPEGYVFGETYQFNSGATVEDVLTRTFDEFNKWVVQDNLVAAFKEHGLTLYQGITLASIVQRESGGDDKAQIAQVFYTRMAQNMTLGSDVTYQYIADKTGVARDPSLDSPYNTRRYVGLPPGPIAVPGLAALRAVAEPAAGDYIFFLSGDDHVTYFARTLEEHEANIKNHCQVKCQII